MKLKKDVISGFFFVALSIFFFVSSFSIKLSSFSEYSSRLLPRIVSMLMFGLGSMQIIINWKKSDTEDSTISKRELVQVLVSFVSLLVYAISLDLIGFIIATTLLMVVQMLIISNWAVKKLTMFAIISLATSVGFYFLFSRVFFLMLPAGILG